jgi:hypothetical protein
MGLHTVPVIFHGACSSSSSAATRPSAEGHRCWRTPWPQRTCMKACFELCLGTWAPPSSNTPPLFPATNPHAMTGTFSTLDEMSGLLTSLTRHQPASALDTSSPREGFVVRTTAAIPVPSFERCVAKYVRQGHVQVNPGAGARQRLPLVARVHVAAASSLHACVNVHPDLCGFSSRWMMLLSVCQQVCPPAIGPWAVLARMPTDRWNVAPDMASGSGGGAGA